jgi:SpoVK/Ycf46/Vps4 family AAA+-type ATPase
VVLAHVPVEFCLLVFAHVQLDSGKYVPVELHDGRTTPCDHCPRDPRTGNPINGQDCPHCHCKCCRLFDLPSADSLQVPDLTYADFERVVRKSKPSVSGDDLLRYQEWTAEFGVEGS